MQGNPAFNSLIDMGISPILAQAAIRNTKSADVSQLLDWISDHSEEQQKWSKWLEENKEEKVEVSQGQSISHLVNQAFVDELVAKGNSKAVAEKSILLSGNTSVASAEAWIEKNRYEPDFEEPLMLEGQQQEESTLTDEEARIKLKQLTEKARENRKKREEEEERERQKNRVRYGKEMTEAKRIADEQAMKRKVQLDKIEKKRDEEYKKKLLQQMKREKNERLGIKEDPTTGKVEKKVEEKPQLSLLEQVELQCEQVKIGMHAYPDRAKTFFETVQIYVNNIIKNNGQEKFRKINLENKAFKSRIAECFGGVETLEALGYVEEEGFLIMKEFKLDILEKASTIFGRYKALY